MFALRPGFSADIEAMYELDLLCFEEPFRFSLRAMRFYAAQKNSFTVIAQAGAALAGFVIVEVAGKGIDRAGYVITLDVHPDFRRAGVASALMTQAELQAAKLDALDMNLHVHPGNEGALLFYRRQGYSARALVRDFYGRGLDAQVYNKLLKP